MKDTPRQEQRSSSNKDGAGPALRLGQQIYDRYGRSPGLLAPPSEIGMAGSMVTFGMERLPILASIQRRFGSRSLSNAWPLADNVWRSPGRKPLRKGKPAATIDLGSQAGPRAALLPEADSTPHGESLVSSTVAVAHASPLAPAPPELQHSSEISVPGHRGDAVGPWERTAGLSTSLGMTEPREAASLSFAGDKKVKDSATGLTEPVGSSATNQDAKQLFTAGDVTEEAGEATAFVTAEPLQRSHEVTPAAELHRMHSTPLSTSSHLPNLSLNPTLSVKGHRLGPAAGSKQAESSGNGLNADVPVNEVFARGERKLATQAPELDAPGVPTAKSSEGSSATTRLGELLAGRQNNSITSDGTVSAVQLQRPIIARSARQGSHAASPAQAKSEVAEAGELRGMRPLPYSSPLPSEPVDSGGLQALRTDELKTAGGDADKGHAQESAMQTLVSAQPVGRVTGREGNLEPRTHRLHGPKDVAPASQPSDKKPEGATAEASLSAAMEWPVAPASPASRTQTIDPSVHGADTASSSPDSPVASVQKTEDTASVVLAHESTPQFAMGDAGQMIHLNRQDQIGEHPFAGPEPEKKVPVAVATSKPQAAGFDEPLPAVRPVQAKVPPHAQTLNSGDPQGHRALAGLHHLGRPQADQKATPSAVSKVGSASPVAVAAASSKGHTAPAHTVHRSAVSSASGPAFVNRERASGQSAKVGIPGGASPQIAVAGTEASRLQEPTRASATAAANAGNNLVVHGDAPVKSATVRPHSAALPVTAAREFHHRVQPSTKPSAASARMAAPGYSPALPHFAPPVPVAETTRLSSNARQGGTRVMRQKVESSDAQPEFGSAGVSSPLRPSAPAGPDKMDVNQIANRVYEMLVRKLGSERQRRGM